MGTTWEVLIDIPPEARIPQDLGDAFQASVDEVDDQMSTWSPDSALMRFNAAPTGEWLALPDPLLAVLEAGLSVSAATDGAFEMNLGDAIRAWGFGSGGIDLNAIRTASAARRVPAREALQIDRRAGLARKSAPLALDLSGIAKGYGVDRLAETARALGFAHALCSIDGEVRAIGTRLDGALWSIGIDDPHGSSRGDHSVITLDDTAVATSGDYRHFLTIRGRRLSHTFSPATRAPLPDAPASVTVIARSCMMADAMATALMVLGMDAGPGFAQSHGMSTLFIARNGEVRATGQFSG
ncbi:MAG: hypothetical protein RL216_2803 [Pseudomonadota bacterium]